MALGLNAAVSCGGLMESYTYHRLWGSSLKEGGSGPEGGPPLHCHVTVGGAWP